MLVYKISTTIQTLGKKTEKCQVNAEGGAENDVNQSPIRARRA